jgi:hypothetical protein
LDILIAFVELIATAIIPVDDSDILAHVPIRNTVHV